MDDPGMVVADLRDELLFAYGDGARAPNDADLSGYNSISVYAASIIHV